MNQLKSFFKATVPKRYIPELREFRDFIRGLFYIGNLFICPVCGGNFRKFRDFGAVSKANEQCPRCLSLKRHRLLWLYLKEKTNFFDDNLKVLHIAPEYYFYQKFSKQKNLDYISADIQSPLAKVKMDITNIVYEDNLFDVIFAIAS
ncbi:MAG: hypothetical protein SXA11_03020 [Cyanobacteriota bacterium]|nr:hypothetical protein [Cyanobacteriota bacterium]